MNSCSATFLTEVPNCSTDMIPLIQYCSVPHRSLGANLVVIVVVGGKGLSMSAINDDVVCQCVIRIFMGLNCFTAYTNIILHISHYLRYRVITEQDIEFELPYVGDSVKNAVVETRER